MRGFRQRHSEILRAATAWRQVGLDLLGCFFCMIHSYRDGEAHEPLQFIRVDACFILYKVSAKATG